MKRRSYVATYTLDWKSFIVPSLIIGGVIAAVHVATVFIEALAMYLTSGL